MHLKIYSREEIVALTRKRHLESKIGEQVDYIKHQTDLKEEIKASKAHFVLLGLPEDIGVRANYGRGGTHTAWKPALENILNLQSNEFLSGKEILVLGHVDFDDLMEKASHIHTKDRSSIEKLRKLVEFVDVRVFETIKLIISCGKIPIIIGGGHNNAYPNIKGVNEGLRESGKMKVKGINVVNCDPHADFRPLEGRHSGNGFSYAFEENILHKYAIVGLHESYNTDNVVNKFRNNEGLNYTTFEDIFIREKISFPEAIKQCCDFCNDNYCGVELDLDAITNVPSSAKTSSGISPLQARQYVYHAAGQLNKVSYLHVCEGAPVLAHIKADNKTGKLIAYLVSDFMKGVLEKEKN
ncbi:MAG: arginase family protein [Bacteroidia bacterium]